MRFQIFKENLNFIHSHNWNAMKEGEYLLGVNKLLT